MSCNFILQFHPIIVLHDLLMLRDVKIARLNLVCRFVFVGVISLSRSVYGKANSVIPMVISAQDGGGLVALVNARVNISVVAGLVAPPVFEQTQYYFTVSEDVLRGTVVGIVQASSKTGGVHKHTPSRHSQTPTFEAHSPWSIYIYQSRWIVLKSVSFLLPAPLVQIGIGPLYTPNSEITSIKNSISQLCLYIHFLSF